MPLFYTPGQFARQADLYRRLGQLMAAGLPATQALQQLERHPPGKSFRKPLTVTIAGIEGGGTLGESARNAGRWLPEIDLALLDAGETSGRLEACLGVLADYYEERARIARDLIAALIYPTFLLHAAVFILAIPQYFPTGDWLGLLLKAATILLPIYAIVALCIYLMQSRHGERWRALVERVLAMVPLLGTARREMALARLAMALEALLAAGVTIIEAWELAAASSGSPALRRAVNRWLPALREGRTPAEMVNETRLFPEVFASQYSTGEISGKLDENLARLHKYYREAASRKLHLLAQWFPWLVYGAVAGYIAYRIIQFWAGYFQQIQNVL